MTEIEKDMAKIAKLIWRVSLKHKDIYISASKCPGASHSSVTYTNKLSSVEFWGDEKQLTKNVTEYLEGME
jgi:hypothetical protein